MHRVQPRSHRSRPRKKRILYANGQRYQQLASFDILPRAESIALLRGHRGDLGDTDAGAIADALGDLPLMLTLAGRYLDTYRDESFGPPDAYLANLQKQLL